LVWYRYGRRVKKVSENGRIYETASIMKLFFSTVTFSLSKSLYVQGGSAHACTYRTWTLDRYRYLDPDEALWLRGRRCWCRGSRSREGEEAGNFN
jgi:hypothetical protein